MNKTTIKNKIIEAYSLFETPSYESIRNFIDYHEKIVLSDEEISGFILELKKEGKIGLENWEKNMDEMMFKEIVLENAAFLVDQFQFCDPEIRFGAFLFKEIIYKKRESALEFHFDIKDDFAGAYIIKLQNGQIPDHLMEDEEGNIVRYLLKLGLYETGRDPYKYFKKGKRPFDETMKSYKELLIHECSDILAGSAEIFNKLNEIK